MNKWFKISKEEIEFSQTAVRNELDNSIPDELIENVNALVENIWFPMRVKYGSVIHISSGFRGKKLNKLIGGAVSSQHCKGQAFDLVCNDMKKLLSICLNLNYDQLIIEDLKEDGSFKWLHISFDRDKDKQRKDLLIMKRVKGKTVYERVNKEYALSI
ncbi:MAG: D-Ala-D-Ala carboxypeptidase family metallohydrolase [Tissierellales bacterium]|nr:D-Ala-D-Ala carboxypeptidase family metallohydrolase [Tissierellales bacterium]